MSATSARAATVVDYAVGLVVRLGHWGYLIVFLGAMLESAAFVGLFVPGESLVLVAGFLSGQHVLDLDVVLLAVALGAVVGDNIGYELGRRLGRSWSNRFGRHFGLSPVRMERVETFFRRHGGNAVFLGRFVGFARALVPFVAGSAGMARLRFFAANILGGTLWSAVVVLLGYFVGRVAERWIGEASAIAGGALVAAFLLIGIWRWALSREALIRQGWQWFLGRLRVSSVIDRVSPGIEWLRDRFSPSGLVGLQLTVGAAVFAAAAWLFGSVAEDVASGGPATAADVWLEGWFQAHQNARATELLRAVGRTADWRPIAVATLVFVLYLIWARAWRWIVLTLCTVPIGMGVNGLLKLSLLRAMPSLSALPGVLGTHDFPNERVMSAVLWYGTLAMFNASRTSTWRWQVLGFVLAFALAALVSLSQLYMRGHYLSDVVAGAAGGVAWLALCYLTVRATMIEPPES